MSSRLAAALGLAFALSAGVAVADQDGTSSAVDEGVTLFEDLEFEAAAEALTKALEKGALDRKSKIRGLKFLALAQVALGKENAARDSFRQALELDRKFALESTRSPRALEVLEEVRLDLPGRVRLKIVSQEGGERSGSPLTLTIVATDPSDVVRGVIVHFRGGDDAGGGPFSTVQATPLADNGRFTATVPGAFVSQPTLEFYVTAQAVTGEQLASIGAADDTTTIAVAAKKKGRSVLASPLLWAGVGAVVIGGSVAAYLALREEPRKTGFINILPR